MSIVVTNQAPKQDAITAISVPLRCSIRDSSPGAVVYQSGVTWWLGNGPCFYDARASQKRPEEVHPEFCELDVWSGMPEGEASISFDSGVEGLRILKAGAENLKGLYYFGGLLAPATPDGPLLAEFELQLDSADVISHNEFTGVLFGVLVGDGGFTIRFRLTSGDVGYLEAFDVVSGSTQRIAWPTLKYHSAFNWNDGAAHRYRVLWYPELNLMKLWVVVDGQNDMLLLDGNTSDFPTFPGEPLRINQPWGFFGHGLPAAQSSSVWYRAALHNDVRQVLASGIPGSRSKVRIQHNDRVHFLGKVGLDFSDVGWQVSGDGRAQVVGEALKLSRSTQAESLDVFREEPRLAGTGITVLDFSVKGESYLQDLGSITTGLEVYWSDAAKSVCVAFLEKDGTQYVGIATSDQKNSLSSYQYAQTAWSEFRDYRLIVRPEGVVTLAQLTYSPEGFTEVRLLAIAYSDIHAAPKASPRIGFSNSPAYTSGFGSLHVKELSYSRDIRWIEDYDLFPAEWEQHGGVGPDDYFDLPDAWLIHNASGGDMYEQRDEVPFTTAFGVTAEALMKIDSYSVGEETSPAYCATGIGLSIHNGNREYRMVLGDLGAAGKIVFLSTVDDIDENLLQIRQGLREGTYAPVDWTSFHRYRMELLPGQVLNLYIDAGKSPVASVSAVDYLSNPFDDGVPTTKQCVQFGALKPGVVSDSSWRNVRYTLSDGVDVSVDAIRDNEKATEFTDHSVMSVVSVEVA